jgi:putative transcriptional regulator
MAVKHNYNYTELLKESLQEAAEIRLGAKASRETTREVLDVIAVREAMNLTRAKFAGMIGISERTLENWEQGRTKPSGAARSLLRVASRQPQVVFEVLR